MTHILSQLQSHREAPNLEQQLFPRGRGSLAGRQGNACPLCRPPSLDFSFPPSCFSQGHKAPSPSKPCRSPANTSASLRCNLGNSLTNRDLLSPEKPRPESQERGLGSGFELVARTLSPSEVPFQNCPCPAGASAWDAWGPGRLRPAGPGLARSSQERQRPSVLLHKIKIKPTALAHLTDGRDKLLNEVAEASDAASLCIFFLVFLISYLFVSHEI